jgi:hypothetical protein
MSKSVNHGRCLSAELLQDINPYDRLNAEGASDSSDDDIIPEHFSDKFSAPHSAAKPKLPTLDLSKIDWSKRAKPTGP